MRIIFLIFLLMVSPIVAIDEAITSLIKRLNWTQEDIRNRGKKEIKAFVTSGHWQGGYYEGNPTDMHGTSSYHRYFEYHEKLVNPLYIVYQECLVPYIDQTKTVLEIGPGRGAWTKAILGLSPKNIICLDALPVTYNRFWEYVGRTNKVTYYQTYDYDLHELKENSIDFVFSFGVFCHISPVLFYEYFKNLYPKLKSGAQCFVMYADYDKYNMYAQKYNIPFIKKDDEYLTLSSEPVPCCWYHLGIERAKTILCDLGYEVINADMSVNERDPVIYFKK